LIGIFIATCQTQASILILQLVTPKCLSVKIASTHDFLSTDTLERIRSCLQPSKAQLNGSEEICFII